MIKTIRPALAVHGATQVVRDLPGATSLDRLPAVLNTVGAALVIVGSLLGALATPRFEVTTSLLAPAATLLSSDARTFWMWWAIVVAMTGFVGWQWLPTRRRSQRLATIPLPALLAGSFYLGWVLAVYSGLVITSVVLLGLTLVALYVVVRLFVLHPSPSILEHIATDTGWGLALGFGNVQLLASVGVVVETYNLATGQLYEIVAIVAYIAFIAGALGLAGRLYHQFQVGLALVWGFGWMGWHRFAGEPRNLVLATLAGLGCLLIVAAFYASARRRRRNIKGLRERTWR